jgi:3-methylfumaryl-CoA hydratase
VAAVEDDGMTLELIEEQPSGEVGFEGTVRVSRTGAARTGARPVATAGAST